MEQPSTIKIDGISSFFRRIADGTSASLKAPFPFYLNDNRKNLILVFVISVFVTGFLYLFKTQTAPPFSEGLAGLEWLHGLITLVCLLINIILLPKLFPAAMDPVSWTYKKYILLNVLHLVMIWVACTLIEKPLFCPFLSWTETASHVGTQVALKGIIPIALIRSLKKLKH